MPVEDLLGKLSQLIFLARFARFLHHTLLLFFLSA